MSLGPVPTQISHLFFPYRVFSDTFSLAAPQTIMFASGCSALDLFDLNELE